MIHPSIFKSYDIRGIYPTQLDEAGARAIARALVQVTGARTMVVGKDVRASGPALAQAAIDALLEAGTNVVDIGTVSTDMFYFAVATLDVDGGFTISASHNPGNWNGFNCCRRGAVPLSLASGLDQVRDLAMADSGTVVKASRKGTYTQHDVWDEFADYVLSYVDRSLIRPTRLVANGNCGLQVEALRRVVARGRLPLTIHGIYDKPDGSFPVPGGVPNPLLPANQGELVATVLADRADLGVAWDADGDRCFFVDETGYFLSGYFTTAILARSILSHNPGATVVIDPRSIWATQETIATLGGKTVLSRAGMTIIPGKMRDVDAAFAGEMSAHFYFARNWYRDNGMIPLLLMLELLGRENKPLSALVAPLRQRYFASGEINFIVPDAPATIAKVEDQFRDGERDHTDGLSVAYPDWRFNLRSSNTEPLLRLNVEARSHEALDRGLARVESLLGNRAEGH
ncbi:MAG TPA: phosphomannomutase/phosphoglucomutase [Terriglobales bacterium]|nr:phosphomannomutase/phosphoglucomutase [Terriglobales bacterium]